MSLQAWRHDGDHFRVQATRVDGDAAWYFELSEGEPALSSGSVGDPHVYYGPAAVTVIAHDTDVEKPPYVFFDGAQEIPLEVLKRFVDLVTKEIDRQ